MSVCVTRQSLHVVGSVTGRSELEKASTHARAHVLALALTCTRAPAWRADTLVPREERCSCRVWGRGRRGPLLGQNGLEVIRKAYDAKLSNVQVQSIGRVKAVLRDDNEGSRHQKFILALDNGLTVLVAHNIDLAPHIDNLRKGDTVEFFGEYEYSNQGGVMHWTHHDPKRRHQDGWLKHNGKTYQ